MSKEIRERIREVYFSSNGLWGPSKIAKQYRLPLKIVKEELQNFEVYQRTRPISQKQIRKHQAKIIGKPRVKVGNKWVEYSVSMDLYDWAGKGEIKRKLNEGWRYVLGIISTFSRRVWLYKTKTKSEAELYPILRKHFQEFPTRSITADRESAWYKNKRFKAYCKSRNPPIKQYFTATWGGKDTRTGMIERFWRTLAGQLHKLQIYHKNKNVFQYIKQIEENYNSTVHRAFKDKVSPLGTWYSNVSSEIQERDIKKFEIGDTVRIRIHHKLFDKKSKPNWSAQTYGVIDHKGVRYKLEQEDGKPYKNLVLPQDMMKIDKDKLFKVRRSMRGRQEGNIFGKLVSLPEKTPMKIPGQKVVSKIPVIRAAKIPRRIPLPSKYMQTKARKKPSVMPKKYFQRVGTQFRSTAPLPPLRRHRRPR